MFPALLLLAILTGAALLVISWGVETAAEEGEIYYVDGENGSPPPVGNGSEERPFRTIQQGVDAAADGDVIIIKAAVYEDPVEISKNLSLRAQSLHEAVVDISVGHAFRITNATVTIEGFTIKNADVGISAEDSVLALFECTITGCDRDGINLSRGSLSVNGSEISNNGKNGISSFHASVALVDCEMNNNENNGVYFHSTRGSLAENCRFVSSSGYGAFVDDSRDANLTFLGCTFEDNLEGVRIENSSGIVVQDSAIVDSGTCDMGIYDSYVDLVDFTLGTTNFTTGGDFRLITRNTLTVRVLVDDEPVDGADVRITVDGEPVYASLHFGGRDPRTDVKGHIRPVRVELLRADAHGVHFSNISVSAFLENSFIDHEDVNVSLGKNTEVLEFRTDAGRYPPRVSFESPAAGSGLSGTVQVTGEARPGWDSGAVEFVEIAVGDSVYRRAEGAEDWRFSWDTSFMIPGKYILRARAYDGRNYSEIQELAVTVTGPGNSRPEITSLMVEPVDEGRAPSFLVTGSVRDADGTDDVSRIQVQVVDPSSHIVVELGRDDMNLTGRSGDTIVFTFVVERDRLGGPGNYTIVVIASDSQEEFSETASESFAVGAGREEENDRGSYGQLHWIVSAGMVALFLMGLGYFYALHTGFTAHRANCPVCTERARYIRQYRDYYCYDCKKYLGDMEGNGYPTLRH